MMSKKLIKVGAIGSLLAAVCCFTPILVWVFALIGLSSAIVYLDFILLPLLGIFVILLISGLILWLKNKQSA